MRTNVSVLFGLTALLGLAGALSQNVGSEEECLREYEPYHEAYLAGRNEGPAERQDLLDRLAPLIERHGEQRGRCTASLFDHRLVLLVLEERFANSVSLADSVLALGRFANSTDLRVRMLQNLSVVQWIMGQSAASTQTLLLAAAHADGLPARSAVHLMTDIVQELGTAGDFQGADRYTARGARIARDSLARDSSLYGAWGRLYVMRGIGDLRQIDATRDTVERTHIAHRLLRRMDRALALYARGRPAIAIDDQDEDILAYGLKAVALAALGRDREAREQLDIAWPLAPDALFPDYVASLLEDFQSVTFRLSGNWEAALASATRYLAAEGESETGQAEGWYQVGVASEHLGRDSAAAEAYRASILWFEESRADLSLQDWNATSFVDAQKPYLALARLLVRKNRPDEAFDVLERSRVRHLLDVRASLQVQATLRPGTQARADSLTARRADLRVRRLAHRASLAETAALDAEIAGINTALADLTGQRAERSVPSLSAIQRALARDGRVLVAPILGEADGIAFVVTADTLVAVSLPIGVAGLRAEMRRLGGPWRPDGDADPAIALAPLHRLYNALLAPLAVWLPDGAPLVVIPDDVMMGLPFEMLVEQPAEGYDTAAFVVRSRPVATELAATLLVEPGSPRTDAPTYDLVAFGRSDYGPGSPSLRNGDGPLSDLPFVDDEIRRVSAHARHGQTALNREATEDRLDAVIGDAQVVHLAAHATPDPAFPLYSRVFLWGDEGEADGTLHLYELMDRPLRADLVVLSGCSTARGPAVAGEGLLGLQHAVRAAGARSSLATLWPVEDRAMVELMRTFYDGLSEGLRKDEALQQAQLAYLDGHHGIEASPFYWAALVLSGDVAPVPLRTPARPWGPIGVAAVVLVALGLAWTLARRRHA